MPLPPGGLVGHESVEATMIRAHAAGRMPHAWLLTGAPGIGKATLASLFARWLLLGGQPRGRFDFDDRHPAAKLIDSGAHPDLRVLAREINEKTGKLRSEIAVSQARASIDFMRLTPALGGWRIVIVDAADDFNAESANALLKVIEEPPPRALFVIVAHAVNRVLPTIRSRCRRLALQPLSEAGVVAVIRRHAPDLTEPDAVALARLAEGSPGRALALATAGGPDLLREMEALLATLPSLDPAALDRLADKAARGGEETVNVLRDLVLGWIGSRTKAALNVAGAAARPRLDRWARLWENTRRLFERAEAASLDRKQALLEIFYDIEATARAA
jgi:DNA polymerase-3 subunit delta'